MSNIGKFKTDVRQYYLLSQPAKSIKVTMKEGVFIESAFNMRCHIVKNTLLHIAFSAIILAGMYIDIELPLRFY